MDAQEVLTEHLALCERVYELLGEENRQLKSTGRLTNELLARKQALLDQLDHSLSALKALPSGKSAATAPLIDKAQRRLMQIFLLDRDNERLLSQGSRPAPSRQVRPPRLHLYTSDETPSASPHEETAQAAFQPRRLHRAYREHLQSNEELQEDFSEEHEL